jgi:formylglycine-generating enzyme required for sulfatase activity
MFNTRFSILFIFVFIFSQNVSANNISISNVSLTAANTSSGLNNAANFRFAQFDISWENSWRTSSAPNNWDAAWVFMKYRVNRSGDWLHATLNAGANQTAPTGGVIDVPADGVGAFIYRSANGTGTFTLTNAQLRWNYGANGVLDNDIIEIKIFAIEMVYVPQGSFYVGSGGSEAGSFTNGSWTTGNTIPFQITSENALDIAQNSGNLWATSNINSGTLSATYPKGFASFYCMKYEASQGQIRDFLNTLTYAQQLTLLPISPNSAANSGAFITPITARNAVKIKTSGVASSKPAVYGCNLNNNTVFDENDDGEHIACNYFSWMSAAAFLDWSGLRPMSDLEFEKACRGDQAPVLNEYVWGSITLINPLSYSNLGALNEISNTNFSNAHYYNTILSGPIRVGTFANSTSNRVQSGATYYGIMNMGDNLTEPIVTVGNTAGRSYTGLHGNGILLSNGKADVSYWPGINGNTSETNANGISDGVTGIPSSTAAGTGFRGGAYTYNSAIHLRTSYRGAAASSMGVGISSSIGIRGVRTIL